MAACATATPRFINSSFPGIEIFADTADAYFVEGVKGIASYTIDGNTFTVSEGGKFDITVLGTGIISSITANGNAINNNAGQIKLREYAGCKTALEGADLVKFYLDKRAASKVFIIMDLAKESTGVMRVKMAATQAGDVNNNYPVNWEFCVEGMPVTMSYHYLDPQTVPATPDITFTANTIVDATAGFITAGAAVGQTVYVGGVGTPNTGAMATILTVVAGLITTVEATPFTIDAAGDVLTELSFGTL